MSQDIYYNSDEIILENLLNDCIIVFDTNVLLNLLPLSEQGLKDFKSLIEEIAKKNIKLFIPGQVVFEFNKNKLKKLKEPADNLENFLNNNDSFKEVKKYSAFFEKEEKKFSEITNKLTQSKQFLSSKDKHPYLEDKHISSIDAEIEKILETIRGFFEEIKQDFKKVIDTFETSINEQKRNSDFTNNISFVEQIIKKNMNKSVPWSFEEKLKFVNEGKIRYEHSIAPGYEDITKSGLGKYGDFFVWKEILLFGAKENKNCIFVSDDNKSDWVILNQNKKYRSPTTPDNDLILEYSSETKKQFWMLNTKEFFYKLGEYTNKKASEKTMDEVDKISKINQFHLSETHMENLRKLSENSSLYEKALFLINNKNNYDYKRLEDSIASDSVMEKIQKLIALNEEKKAKINLFDDFNRQIEQDE